MRDRIAGAALECMREYGVRGTTTKVIARRAGVAEGSIYNHFATRSELIIEAFGLATSEMRRRAQSLGNLVGTKTVEENLVTLMGSIVEFLREISPIAGSILGDSELRSWFANGTVADSHGEPLSPLTGVTELSDYLECEHQQGRIAKQLPWRTCASVLIGACLQYVYLEQLSPSAIAEMRSSGGKSPAEYAREVVRIVLNG